MAQGLHAPAVGLNTIIFKYVFWYMKRLQDLWSSGLKNPTVDSFTYIKKTNEKAGSEKCIFR